MARNTRKVMELNSMSQSFGHYIMHIRPRETRNRYPPDNLAKTSTNSAKLLMNFREKIISWDDLPAWRQQMRQTGKRLVVTNGCFDLLHLGHVTYLETARNHGDA